VCRRYRASAVTDQHKAAGVVDRLARLGVSCRSVPMTERSKTDVYRELRARLNSGELGLYPQPQLLAELRRVRSRFQANRASVFIPRVGGSHGDIAQALSLAVWQHRGSRSDRTRGREWRSSARADSGSRSRASSGAVGGRALDTRTRARASALGWNSTVRESLDEEGAA
jgi:hypothetical protein